MAKKIDGLPVNGKIRIIEKGGLSRNPSLDFLHINSINKALALLDEKERAGLRILIKLRTLIRKRKMSGEHFNNEAFRNKVKSLLEELYNLNLIKKIDRPFTPFGSVKFKTIVDSLTSSKLKSIMDFKESRRNFETNELFNLPFFRALRMKYNSLRTASIFFRRNSR